ncbi:Fc.00g064070.m01.CDS01 [Cosmosporella sp. VM-42]
MLSYDSPFPVKGQKAPTATSLPPSFESPSSKGSVMAAPKSSHVSASANVHQHQHRYHHIWLVTGPAGCGKTTVAEYLADSLGMPYIEGDSFHPSANVEKMRNGIPLTDSDRWDWLTALREESINRINEGSEGVVLTCSALKRKYRDVIRVAGYFDHRLLIHFIFLSAPEEVLLQRVQQRQGHYMGANMVHSQFDILELPSRDEKDVVSIDVSRSIDEVNRDALSSVFETISGDDA